MNRLLFPALFSTLLALPAHALIDTDTDGFSDVWEGRYGFTIGATPPANQSPTADPDGDGWTNAQEALAGTDPVSAASPNGILAPAVAYTKAIVEPPPPGADIGQPVAPPPTGDPNDPFGGASSGGGTYSEPLEIRRAARFNLTWAIVKGKAYQVHVSQDLVNWQPAGGFVLGNIEPLTFQGQALSTDNTEPPKLFYRIKIEDADSDGDTLTDYEETLLALDPYSKDSDKDGIPDNTDPQPTVNSLTSDPDGPGLPASLANGLIGRWDFEQVVPAPGTPPYNNPFRYVDTSGYQRHITPFGAIDQQLGIPSKGTKTTGIYGGFLCPPRTLLHNQTRYTASLWTAIDPGTITATGLESLAGLFTHHKLELYTTNNVTYPERKIVKVDGFWIETIGGVQTLLAGTATYRTYAEGQFSGLPPLLNPPAKSFTGLSVPFPQGFDDGKFHHFVFVRDSGLIEVYRDGILLGTGSSNLAGISAPNETDVGISFGRFYGKPAENGPFQFNLPNLHASFDRLRVWNRRVTPSEATDLYRQDIDGDGLWDITETKTRLWRDENSDAVTQDSEHRFISSPYLWQPAITDTDGDGLADLAEQTLGTEIHDTDTDDDRLPDGWEVKYGLNPFVAIGADGPDGDPDGDGLKNIDEYAYGTKPKSLPGDPPLGQRGSAWDSDGDDKGDKTEVDAGGHPGDASDGGLPIPPEEKFSLRLAIGDQSGSHSEDYSLLVRRIDPLTGKESPDPFYVVHSGGFGQFKDETKSIFRKGETYSFQIRWNGTNNNKRSANSSQGITAEGPDFDLTAIVERVGTSEGILIDGYDFDKEHLDPDNKLLYNQGNDLAADEDEFKEKFQNRRVVMLGVRTLSADRMFGASYPVLRGMEYIKLKLSNSVTGEDFGTYAEPTNTAYHDVRDIYGAGDNFGRNITDPKAFLIYRQDAALRTMQVYATADPALPYGEIKVELSLGSHNFGHIKRTLQANADMNALIATTTDVAKGMNLGCPGDPNNPVNGVALPTPQRYSTPLLIPVLLVGHTLENTTLLIDGLGDGIVAGFRDDCLFFQLIANAPYLAGYNAAQYMAPHLAQWRTDPVGRMAALSDTIYRFLQNHVCDPVKAQAAELGTLQGWMDFAWKTNPAMIQVKLYQALADRIGSDPLAVLAQSLGAWWDDFNTRMMSGAEKNAWAGEPFPHNALVSGAIAGRRTFFYGTGYGTGYVAEQVATGIATVGAVTIGKAVAVNGAKLTSKLAARTIVITAARASILKKYISGAAMSLELRLALEEGFTLAARTPAAGAGSKNVLTVIEESYNALPPGNVTATAKHLVDGIAGSPRISALALIPGGSLKYLRATGEVSYRLGAKATEQNLRNWPKLADRLIKLNADSTIETRFDDLFTLLRVDTPNGAEVLAKSLVGFSNGSGKFWVKGLEDVQTKAYRYVTQFDLDQITSNGGKLPLHATREGQYVTLDGTLPSGLAAKSSLQLPRPANEYIGRIEFDILPIKDNFRVPKGSNDTLEVLEPLARDNPSFGSPGGGSQLLLDGAQPNVAFKSFGSF